MTLCAKYQRRQHFFGEIDSNTVSRHEDTHVFVTVELQAASNPRTHSKVVCSLGALLDEVAKRKEHLFRKPCHPGRSPEMIMPDITL
jgi:hypothetical protein